MKIGGKATHSLPGSRDALPVSVEIHHLRTDRSHIGIIGPWIEVYDHPDDFHRKFVD
jgi:hypothetical protein